MNANYDFSCGFSTNTTTGFSENMLDADMFGRAAAAPLISQVTNFNLINPNQAAGPLISQATNFNPINPNQPPLGHAQAYMQENIAVKERCKALETQLMKVTTEHDTLKMMLDQLSVSLQKPPSPQTKSAEMYPKLRFWTQSKYNQWTNTPEAHGDTRYKFAFIEDEQGNTVPDGTLKAIRKTIRGCWAKLVVKSMAPKSWGKANASAKEVVYSLAYKSFPFLQLAENDWKIDLLCSIDYPGWVRNNLDDKGNWVASRRVKQEDKAATGDEPQGCGSKKRKAKAVKSKPMEKRFKDDSTQENFPATSATSPDVLTTELPVVTTDDAVRLPLPISLSVSPGILQGDASKPVSPLTLSTSPPVPGQSNPSSPPPIPILDSNMKLSTSPGILPQGDVSKPLSITLDSSESVPAGQSNISSPPPTPALDSNIDPSNDTDSSEGHLAEALTQPPEDATITPIVVNPLSNLAKKSVILKLPPLPPMPKVVAKDKNEGNEGNGEGVGTRSNSSNSKGKTTSNRKSKMRPTKNRMAYNLCALRWLAQINENGNCNEFCTYWNDQLNEQQREAYKNEVKELVEKNAWDDTVSQGTLH